MGTYQAYPKWKYKEGEAPRLVNTHVEEADLGSTWFDKPDYTNHDFDPEEAANSATPPGYQPKEYPKWRYAREVPGGRLVHSEQEENALDPAIDWYDKPDFTDHGQDSTDTTSGAFAAAGIPSGALTGDKDGNVVLAPVPEMKQGVAKTKASNVAEQKDDADFEEEDADTGSGEEDDSEEEVEEAAGEVANDFDQANGVNPGDKAPEGENPNGATGRITKPATEKQTAEETKKTPTAKKPARKKAADDLL
jgi:hypothetical protein